MSLLSRDTLSWRAHHNIVDYGHHCNRMLRFMERDPVVVHNDILDIRIRLSGLGEPHDYIGIR